MGTADDQGVVADLYPLHAWTTALSDDAVASAIGIGLILPEDWVHRRVESINFADPRIVRRKVSMDFTCGAATPELASVAPKYRLVPLTLLEKRTLSNLDVIDAHGGSLPVLTTAQNGLLAARVLRYVTDLFASADITSLYPYLDRIAQLPTKPARAEVQHLVEHLRDLPTDDPLHGLSQSPAYVDYVSQLADNFILAAIVRADAGDRLIVKYSYDTSPPFVAPEVSRWSRLAQSMGWSAREYVIDVPAASSAESFHVDIAAPAGICITGAALFTRGVQFAIEAASADPPDTESVRPLQLPRRGEPTIHHHASGLVSSGAQVGVWMRVARNGWLRSAVLVLGAVASLATANACRLNTLVERATDPHARSVSTDVAALLMAVVALLSSVAIRVGEHPITVRNLATLRMITLAGVSIPLIEGWLLAFGPAGDALQACWTVLAGVSGALLLLAVWAYIGPSAVTPPPYDSA